ncbi:uncharacterized protein LOC116917593 [Daphnia magna]|uniref:Uncharacterized protein n=2 Tax=Daphnia magna TaxID=35525 RepID=A0A164KW28_9CRUS|nr:uncharacterized protein LOC116917593 [Daphnia magna]KAK4018930.1 hypothetical protein OUZ56_000965 [Daphnia magna]KZS03581.1 Uncharacterized protein APZ42_033787 [Daphnia magna]
MLLDLDNVKGKCLAFGVVVFIVLVIVIITGLTSPSHPAKWQASFNSSEIAGNGTQEEYLMLGAIGQYASNRNTIGVDKTGHIKTKWGVG